MWLMTDRESFMLLKDISPKYLLLGGVIGTAITYTVVKAMEGLGPAKSIMLIVTSQVVVGYLIEVMGWFGVEKTGFEAKKIIGVILTIIGIIIFK